MRPKRLARPPRSPATSPAQYLVPAGPRAGGRSQGANVLRTRRADKEASVRKTFAVVAMAVATASLGLVGGASAARVYRQVRYVRLVATSGFYVDNDPSGASGG